MLPLTRDLDIYKGDTFRLTVRLWEKTLDGLVGDPVDLTGSAVKAQVRTDEDATTVSAEMTCAITGVGTVTLTLTPTQTASLATNQVWDLQITFPDGTVRTFVRGQVTVGKEVTR